MKLTIPLAGNVPISKAGPRSRLEMLHQDEKLGKSHQGIREVINKMAKELMWRGKTEEQVKKIDMKEFMELVPSRSRRTLKKGFSDEQKKLLLKIAADDKNMRTHLRDMVIVPVMLGKIIRVYNGKDYFPVMVTLEMLGHFLGEFSHTRKTVAHSAAGIGATRSSKNVSAR